MSKNIYKNLLLVFSILGIYLSLSCDRLDPERIVKISTDSINSITYTSCIALARIIDVGDVGIEEHGFCYGKEKDVDINSSVIDLGQRITTGSYSAKIENLEAGTTYYLKAFAGSEGDYSYGVEKVFTTVKTELPGVSTSPYSELTDNSVKSGGEVSANGGSTITARGVCWSRIENPIVIEDSCTVDGDGLGVFESSVTGLQQNTKYYLRAYAINAVGTSYGQQLEFTTNLVVVPTVTTSEVKELMGVSATVGGEVRSDGGRDVTDRGIYFSTSENAETTGTKLQIGYGTGIFSTNLTGITKGTTYYIKAYASNSIGTSYGDELIIITLTEPNAITSDIVEIAATSAIVGGEVISDGFDAEVERGIYYGTEENCELTGTKIQIGTGVGVFSHKLTGLDLNTSYYVRAYAKNNAYVSYSTELNFITKDGIPVLTSSEVTNLTENSASTGGTISDDGGAEIIERGVCWNTSGSPTIEDEKISSGSGTGSFDCELTRLSPDTDYYIRAYAINAFGTSYGNEIIMTSNGILTDSRDGNVYKYVRIGNQVWMSENLAYLPSVNPSTVQSEYDPTYYVYAYEGSDVAEAKATSNYTTYGVLYNWPAAKTVCPTGWHLPSFEEWNALAQYISDDNGGYDMTGSAEDDWQNVGAHLKATTGWFDNGSGSDDYGFSALPSGFRYAYNDYRSITEGAYWWSTEEQTEIRGYMWGTHYSNNVFARTPFAAYCGFSVRCVKDN